MYVLLESLKVRRGEKGIKNLLREVMAENFLNLGKIRTSKFRTLIGHPKISVQNNLLQNAQH